MQKILVAGVLGGVTVYLWGWVSWAALPWHNATMKNLPQGMAMAQNLGSQQMEKGFYIYPGMDGQMDGEMMKPETEDTGEMEEMTGSEEGMDESTMAMEDGAKEASEMAGDEPVMEGMMASKEGMAMPSEESEVAIGNAPYVFMLYAPEGLDATDPSPYVGGLVLAIISAALVAYLLAMVSASVSSFGQQVVFVVLLGLFAGLVSHGAAWNWMLFPTDYTMVMIADLIIGWALAGAIIAWRMRAAPAAAA